eukprot:926062_1
MSTVVCKYCKSTGSGSKLKCARCHSVYYCNVKCQRADWKQHKSQCERKIILPNVPNIDLNTITKDTIDIQCIQTTKQLRESFNHRKAYTAITNTQCYLTKAMMELFTNILLSPFTFWSVESIDIQFIWSDGKNSKSISDACIRNFFDVTSQLPKLKRFRIQDMDMGDVNEQTFNTRKAYIQSFQLNRYNALGELFIPIDDVFYSCFDYLSFTSFIENACNIHAVDISMRYGSSIRRTSQQMILFAEATKGIFRAICKGLSVESFSFVIDDCWEECIDDIDPCFAKVLFESVSAAIISQRSLSILCINGRTFTKPQQDELWIVLANKVETLSELQLYDNEIRVSSEALDNYHDLIHFIASQKRIEFVRLDGYVGWLSLSDLQEFVNIINKKCKQIKFLRCGWIHFDANTVKSVNTWQVLMELLMHNDNMSLLYFQPFNLDYAYHFDLFPDKVSDIICDAVVQSVLNFNEYMITMETMMSSACEGQKVIIRQIFQYVEDKECKDKVVIRVSCPGGEFESIKDTWSSKAACIMQYVNDKIKQIQTKKQLQYVKTLDFKIL